MDTATRVQILDLTDCISRSTNTLGKGMNPIILPPAIKIDLVSYPAQAEGLVKYDSSTFSSFCWAAQPGTWGPNPFVWRWLSLWHLVPNCDLNSNCDCNANWTQPASDSNCNSSHLWQPGYIIVWCPSPSCGRRMCTEFNPSTGQGNVLTSSVKGQYVTCPWIFVP